MTNDSLVSIVNTTVYGRSKKYRLEDTSEVTLVQWAVETKQLLLANPELAKAKRLLDDSITPEARMLYGAVLSDLRKSRRRTRRGL